MENGKKVIYHLYLVRVPPEITDFLAKSLRISLLNGISKSTQILLVWSKCVP